MSRIAPIVSTICVTLCLAAAPAMGAPRGRAATGAAATNGQTITATGTGQSRVRPRDRHLNSSIAAAFSAARIASITSAIADARARALDYARGVGLTLGPLISVSDEQTSGFYGPGGGFQGPFGPGQFCGTERRPVFKQVNGRRKVVGTRKVHRCIVPQFAFTTLTLTYSAS